MSRTHFLARGACLAFLLVGTPLWAATQPVSEPAAIFAPGDHVPVSEFATAVPGIPTTLHVNRALLAWIVEQGMDVQVARRGPSGQVTYVTPSVNLATGEVTAGVWTGDLVVVAGGLENDFPIVSHWSAAANDPDGSGPALARGGHVPGATDGVIVRDYAIQNGKYGILTMPVDGGVYNTDENHKAPVGGQYVFQTQRYALFSDGSEQTPEKDGEWADADVPGYERYIAENWSLYETTDVAAVWLSDWSRENTGYPILHRNHEAFEPSVPAEAKVLSDAPLFQLVHCTIVDYDDGDPSNGAEQSLATYVLPPRWKAAAPKTYPVLFNGFYDVHDSTFGPMGQHFLTTLGTLYTERGDVAVGVLWNGGGAIASLTMQGSAAGNLAALFDDVEAAAGGDRDRVVCTGGSRGGTTGLFAAGHPTANALTAKYVVAQNPTSHPGESIELFGNHTYYLIQAGLQVMSGFVDAWRQDWVDAAGKSGSQLAAITLLGTDDFDFIDQSLGNAASPFTGTLAAKGTKVVLRVGTHDYSRPCSQTFRYYDALVRAGVPTRLEIGYRLGHGYAILDEAGDPVAPTDVTLLGRVIDGDDSLETGIVHYTPISELDYQVKEFTPDHQPVVLEAPLAASAGQAHSYTLAGEPGATYKVWVAPMDYDAWDSLGAVIQTGPFVVLGSGTLQSQPGDAFGWDTFQRTPQWSLDLPSSYVYLLEYTVGGTTYIVASEGFAPPPYDKPDVPVLTIIGTLGISQEAQSVETRTGGLSAEAQLVQ